MNSKESANLSPKKDNSEITFGERALSRRRRCNDKKIRTFKRKYGKATKSFHDWFKSNYGE